jgi:hypothetical protein
MKKDFVVVPDDVIEDVAHLHVWSLQAIEYALAEDEEAT